MAECTLNCKVEIRFLIIFNVSPYCLFPDDENRKFSVYYMEDSLCLFCNVNIVGNHDNGNALIIQALEQFHISDERTPEEVADSIRQKGYEPVWKDWDGWM